MRLAVRALLAITVPLALAGCTFSANFTVPADQIAELAETALADEHPDLGRPDIDCGQDRVDIVVGERVDCILADPATGADLDTVVTITEVDGTNYSIDVQVADAPRGADTETAPSELTVPSSDLATLAAGALAGELGFTPKIDCEPADVPLVEGETIDCLATGEDGSTGTASITITEVDGVDYRIFTEIK